MSLRNAVKLCLQKNTGFHFNIELASELSAQKNVPIFRLLPKQNEQLDTNLLNDFRKGHKAHFPEFVVDCGIKEENVYFTVDKNLFIKDTLKTFSRDLQKHRTTIGNIDGKKEDLVFEFSSPNIAKPFHIGHLRSTVIGNCLSNVFSFLGHNVNRINYLGDWGMQFGILSVGYDCFGIEGEFVQNPLLHLYHVYVRANEEFQKNENFIKSAKERARILENRSHEKVLLQWQRFREYSVKQYKEVYDRLGVNFDYMHGESMYNQAALEIIKKLEELGLTETQSDGSILIKRKVNDELTIPIMMVSTEGTSLYISRDIAAAVHRKQQFNFDKMFYVVDQEQTAHFVNLKHILRQMGYEWENDLYHVKFGRVLGFSTRKGNVVFLDDIINEAKDRVLEYMKAAYSKREKSEKLNSFNYLLTATKCSENNYKENAEILGVSSVIVNDLLRKRGSNYRFKWKYAISLSGDSGIALQYSHARLHNLEKNSGIDDFLNCDINLEAIDDQKAFKLLLCLSQFDDSLLMTCSSLEPSTLVQYLFQLKSHINQAYLALKVNDEPPSTAETRLVMFVAARNVLHEGMKLIGLKPLEKF